MPVGIATAPESVPREHRRQSLRRAVNITGHVRAGMANALAPESAPADTGGDPCGTGYIIGHGKRARRVSRTRA